MQITKTFLPAEIKVTSNQDIIIELPRDKIIEAKFKVALENKVQCEIDSRIEEKNNPMDEERIEKIIQEKLKEMIGERTEFAAKMSIFGMVQSTIEKNGDQASQILPIKSEKFLVQLGVENNNTISQDKSPYYNDDSIIKDMLK